MNDDTLRVAEKALTIARHMQEDGTIEAGETAVEDCAMNLMGQLTEEVMDSMIAGHKADTASPDREYKRDVNLHQTYVFNYIQVVLDELEFRQATHDQSKLGPEESEIYARVGPQLKQVAFGSPEYDALRAELGTAVQHHYQNNRHHPEHFENGIAGMTLIDLTEMICDWIAASKRRPNVDVIKEMLEVQFPRFGITEPLASILLNTARNLEKGD